MWPPNWVRSDSSASPTSARQAPSPSPSGAPCPPCRPFTVANESYPLSRRLYLYTLPHPRTPLVTDLVNFAQSPEGQQVVRESGYVDLSIAGWSPGPCDARCLPAYAAATLQAKRLTVDFRFRPGTEEL